MGLETFSNFIKDLNITNPAGSDNRSQGDDHIRGIKSTLKGQFSGIAGMATPTQVTADADELNLLDGVTATTVELNYVDGVTSNIQTQIDSKQATLTSTSNGYGTKTISTVNPSGGTDGDIWYKVS